MAAGCTFVALSRLKSLSDEIIQPMSFKRLESIGNSKGYAVEWKKKMNYGQLHYNFTLLHSKLIIDISLAPTHLKSELHLPST